MPRVQRVEIRIATVFGRSIVHLPEFSTTEMVPFDVDPQELALSMAVNAVKEDRANIRLNVIVTNSPISDQQGSAGLAERAHQAQRGVYSLPDRVAEIAEPVHWGVVRDLAPIHADISSRASGDYFPLWRDIPNSAREDYYAAAYPWVIAFEKLAVLGPANSSEQAET